MILADSEEFVRHAIAAHGMTEETWFNIPTSRGYHDYLHRAHADVLDHTHEDDPAVPSDARALTDALARWDVLHAGVRDCADPFADEVCVHDAVTVRG